MMQFFDARTRWFLALGFVLILAMAALSDPMIALLAAHEPRGLHDLGVFVSRFGLSGYMLVISAGLVVVAGWASRSGRAQVLGAVPRLLAERAAYVFVAVAWSGILCQVLKHVIGRARPRFLESLGAYHLVPLNARIGLDSFPSGHTTTVCAVAVALGLLVPSQRAAFIVLAFCVCIARILAGAHYPSDVVAGVALGTVTALWTARAFAARNIAFAMSEAPDLVLKRDRVRIAAS